jgi:hypothetical protein
MVKFTCNMIENDMIDEPDHVTILEMSTYRKLSDYGDESSYGGAAGRHDDHVSALQILCALLRLNAAIGPDTGIGEVDNWSEDSSDEPFDKFRSGDDGSDALFDDDGALAVDDDEVDYAGGGGFYV